MKNNNAGGRNGRRILGPPPQGRSCATNKDEDLVLFRELHKREKDRIASLLLPVSEEFEPSGSANNYHHQASLFRIPWNKKSSLGLESLSGTNNKNDYDWLKTPPATPLFPSLELEAAIAPEMAVQRELPIMQPLSRFTQQVPKQRHEANPNLKSLSTNKPKPFPTPMIKTSKTLKAPKPTTNPIMSCPFLKSNIPKSDPKPKPELSSTTLSKSRDSPSPMITRPSSYQTRTLSSSIGAISYGSGAAPGVKPGTHPRSRVVVVSNNGSRRATETTQLRSPRVRMGEEVITKLTTTTTESSFFGSKMVDKVMNARKCRSEDVAGKTVERGARFGRPGGR